LYTIAIRTHFSASHRVKRYPGKCKNLHGHNWKVKLEVRTDYKDELGMSFDFKELKKIVQPIIDKFDHQYLNDLDFLNDINPTAENIAELLYTETAKKLPEHVSMHRVTIWETDKYSITYQE
jgi:6-pyruvoyltetrahydropterin/6-carboxytetrahydropterin synthase